MRVNLPQCFKQIARTMPSHGATLEQFLQHLRETISGEHTMQELVTTYCLDADAPDGKG